MIPGSHRKNNDLSILSYQKKKILTIHRGDILIFHATLHHRGINYYKHEQRRLLQVFEMFPDKITYEEHASKLMVVQSSNRSLMKHIVTPLLIELSKFPGLVDIINFVHYFLVCNDLQYKIVLMDIEPWNKKDKYITYEPVRRIYHFNHEYINVNVCCDPNIQQLQPSNYYLYMYILYWIVSFVILHYLYEKYKGKGKKIQSSRKYRILTYSNRL